MSRAILTACILAFAAAAPAAAQQPDQTQRTQDPIQKMYDAPLKKLYDDPLRKAHEDSLKRLYGDKQPTIYSPNPLIPGGNPQAPRTLNESRVAKPATPYVPPGAVTAGKPNGEQPALDQRFRRFDRNNDGQVTRDEYVTSSMQRTPANPTAGDLQRDSLRRRFEARFNAADANRNGRISRDEYDASANPKF